MCALSWPVCVFSVFILSGIQQQLLDVVFVLCLAITFEGAAMYCRHCHVYVSARRQQVCCCCCFCPHFGQAMLW